MKFVSLNIVYIVVVLILVYISSGVSRIGAEKSDNYFANFHGAEVQRTVAGAFIRDIRWAAQDGTIYLIRQPNDNGLNIMAVTVTTISENQHVDIEIDNQRVSQFAVQPQVFRKYQSLVRLNWQPFTFWNAILLKNSAIAIVDTREISLLVSDVVFTPLAKMKYPNGFVMLYLILVVVLGTWVYCRFSVNLVRAIYSFFGIVLIGIWWYGIQSIVLYLAPHITLMWFLGGLGLNLLLLYDLYRYFGVIQLFMSRVGMWIQQHLMEVESYVTPIYAGMRWLWQRPILFYSITVALYFGGWLWGPQVISPIDTKFAVNMPFTAADYDTSGGFFSDYVIQYIPELYQMMHEPRSTWIGTWNNTIELGRQTLHYGGWSPSYILTWVMLVFITDPFVFFTITFVLYVYLSGLFALLYVRREFQHTGLALLAAYLILFSPFFFFWNTYLLFYTATCWGIAILYGLIWIRDTPNWKSVLFLTFAIYSLLSMAYPQMTIYVAYMMGGYFLYLLWQLRKDYQKMWQFAVCSIVAGIVGVIMVVPQYLDILQTAALAFSRQKQGIAYFTEVIAHLHTVPEVLQVGFAYILKDIFEPSNKFESRMYSYRGGYTTLFVFLLMMIGAIWRWRQTWGWSLWLVIAVILSFSQTAFAFGYEQLHLPQLSRAAMIWGVGQQIPEMILAVYGMQVIISESVTKSTKIMLGMFGVGIQLIIGACMIAMYRKSYFQWTFNGIYWSIVFEVIVVALILVIALVPSIRVKWTIVFGILFLCTIVLLQPMLLTQPLHEIHVTSPTTEMIRQTLRPGERMAMVDQLEKVIPNALRTFNELTPFGGTFNVVLEIANIGTYGPLQSEYYVALMKRFGVSYYLYNRYIRTIRLPMPENDQWMANIRTIVSKNPLTDPNLTLTARTDGFIPFYVYTTPTTMGCCLQVPLSDVRMVTAAQQDEYWIDTPKAPTNRQLQKNEDQGDRFVVPVAESANESIIVFSQTFHPQWHARVRTAAGWQDAPTVVVNAAYQGARIPAGAQEVVMEFRPWVYWSIIPNIFWLGCLLVWFGRWVWVDTSFQSYIQHLRHRRTV
jgi:hypothetical protein